MKDAVALDKAGVFSIVLECVPREVAAMITQEITVPTIGIGAGPECDGQVLVFHDLVGMTFSVPGKICAPLRRGRRVDPPKPWSISRPTWKPAAIPTMKSPIISPKRPRWNWKRCCAASS